jgi:hypothetical protein
VSSSEQKLNRFWDGDRAVVSRIKYRERGGTVGAAAG